MEVALVDVPDGLAPKGLEARLPHTTDQFVDRTGDEWGPYVVVGFAGMGRGSHWLLKCKTCGTQRVLAAGTMSAFGGVNRCFHRGDKSHPLYELWRQMKSRCHKPRNKTYHLYGGRGIRVCDRWRKSFRLFVRDMGPRPSKQHSIDRIDTNGHYEPGNCRWATHTEQNRNRRVTRKITANGVTRPVAEWSEITGVSLASLYARMKRLEACGASLSEAVTTPPGRTMPSMRNRGNHKK